MDLMENTKVKLVECFQSYQGEGPDTGKRMLILRYKRCNRIDQKNACPFCFGFIGGGHIPTLIKYKKGKVRIDKVKIGDIVLGYNTNIGEFEFTKVINVSDRLVRDIYKIKIEGLKDLYVTGEHPFFTNDGIKIVQNLNVGDEILYLKNKQNFLSSYYMKENNPMKNPETVSKVMLKNNSEPSGIYFRNKNKEKKIQKYNMLINKNTENDLFTTNKFPSFCFKCGDIINFKSKYCRKCCSVISSNNLKKNNPMKNPETVHKNIQTKIKNGTSGFGKSKPEYFGELVSKRMKENNPMKRKDVQFKNILSHSYKKSGSEQYFEKLCKLYNINIEYCGDGKKLVINNHFADFYIPNTNKLIELYDSTFQYSGKYRDEYWKEERRSIFKGYNILFVDANMYFKVVNHEKLINLLKNFIDDNNDFLPENGLKILSIEKINLKKDMKVYNITTENSTYVIDNIIVHNCDTAVKLRISKEFELSLKSIQQEVEEKECGLLITGGEPTWQENFYQTLSLCKNISCSVINIETNGCDLINFNKQILEDENIHQYKEIKYIWSPKIFSEKDLLDNLNILESLSRQSGVNRFYLKVVCLYDEKYLIRIKEFLYKAKKVLFPDHIYLMPEGTSAGSLIANSPIVMDLCEEFKVNFSSREHIIYNFI